MNKPIFNNVPNEHLIIKHKSNQGIINLDYWISRSIATVGVVLIIQLVGGMHVLITQRSNKMRDEKNKYCLPYGYVDFNENIFESMIREVYEETSLYLPDYNDLLITNNNEKPIEIRDNPGNHRQNVSFIYLSVYDFHEHLERLPIYVENYSNNETKLAQWISISDFYCKYDKKLNWAFNHNETIKKAIEFYQSNYIK